MKKVLVFCVALIMVLAICASCTPAGKSSDAAGEKSVTIGVDYATSDKYNLQIFDTVTAMCEEKGWTCFGAEGQRDSEKTLANVDSFMTKGADYIYIVGVDINLQFAIQEKCDKAGVPVVFTAGTTDPAFTITTESIGSTAENATLVVERLIESCKEQWNGECDLAVITVNYESGQDAVDCVEALTALYKKELNVADEDIIVVDCAWDSLKASELFTSMFTANPDKEHIVAWAFVDLHHGVPLYNAAKAAGKLDNLIMGGCNTADDSTAACMKESPNTWVAQMPLSGVENAEVFMNLITDIEENGAKMEKKVYRPSGEATICNAETIQAYYE